MRYTVILLISFVYSEFTHRRHFSFTFFCALFVYANPFLVIYEATLRRVDAASSDSVHCAGRDRAGRERFGAVDRVPSASAAPACVPRLSALAFVWV
jgi:hypothetical protein